MLKRILSHKKSVLYERYHRTTQDREHPKVRKTVSLHCKYTRLAIYCINMHINSKKIIVHKLLVTSKTNSDHYFGIVRGKKD